MKLILRQYLADLRERDELDAILPDLLSELGFTVLSRPGRGTRQSGVDVAAIGTDSEDDGREKLFLFTIKSGDLTRADWNGNPQAVRESLDEIQDSYIRNRIPSHHRHLPIVICVCMGGEMKEAVQQQWTGYVDRHTTREISFREWNGDKLASLLLTGVLRQELLEPDLQVDFQKAVAMVDQPDVSYRFYAELVRGLSSGEKSDCERLTALRQMYVCLWVLFVWARGAGNLEAPYRASELAVLYIWEECRSWIERRGAERERRLAVLDQVIKLHLIIAEILTMQKIGEFAEKPFALSVAVRSQSAVDVNLALFEQLGRLSLFGIWQHWWASSSQEADAARAFADRRNQALRTAIAMINSNPILRSPIRDSFAVEIALFMLLAQTCGAEGATIGYLVDMAHRLDFSIRRRGRFPTISPHYYELADHPRDQTDEYFKEHTKGSVLYPLLIAWLAQMGLDEARQRLANCIKGVLPHTTQQVWVPDGDTDDRLWKGGLDQGIAVTGLDLSIEPSKYLELLRRICYDHNAVFSLSAIRAGLSPIFLMACRHYRLPIPPQVWFAHAIEGEADDGVCLEKEQLEGDG